MTLAGNVAPGGPTTYWVETDAGLRPATGPALNRVEPVPPAAGAVVVTAAGCPIGEAQEGFDWFGQCTAGGDGAVVAPAGGGAALQGTTNEQGRVRFPNLAPGAYALTSLTGGWCHAESDGVDAQGQLLVAAGQRWASGSSPAASRRPRRSEARSGRRCSAPRRAGPLVI